MKKTDTDCIDFHKYNERIVKALAKFGIKAEHNSRNDIAIDGKKFSGNAQFIYKGKVLHHGTLLFNSKLEDVQAALNVKPDKFTSKAVKSVRSRVTNIIDYMDNPVTIQEFKETLLVSLFDDKPLVEYKLSDADLKSINSLMEKKYNTWEWNYGSSPAFNISKAERFPCGGIEVRLEVKKGIINNCKIIGDFFTSENIEDLEKILQGKIYSREVLAQVLAEINIEKYFTGVTQEEFLNFLFN